MNGSLQRSSLPRRGASVGLFLLAGLVASPCAADDPPTLTLLEAASRTLEHFPSLAAASARREMAEREHREAVAARYPSLSLSAQAARYEEPMVATPIHGFTPGALPRFDDVLLQGTVAADWLLIDGGGRGARIDEKGSLAEAAGSEATLARQSLLRHAISSYLGVVNAASTLSAHDRRLEALGAELQRTRHLTEVGRAAEVELRRAEATEAAARAERVRLAAALDVAERALARLTGLDPEAVRAPRLAPAAEVLPPLPSRDACLAAAQATNPDLRRAEQRERAASSAVRAGRSARWPELHAFGNVQNYGTPDDVLESEWNAGLRVQVALFTGGAIGSRIGRAQAASRAAAADAELARIHLEEDLDRSLAAAEEARARAESLRLAVAKFEEVARIEKLRLDAEAGTQTDWLEAESELLVARARLADARHSEFVARAELARVTGDLDLEWLARTLEGRP